MKIPELKKRKTECIKWAQSGFTFEEAGDVNQLIIEQFQARIAELEKLLSGNPQTMTTREMLAMPLNSEIALCNGCYIMRVPGGWIYKDTYNYSDGCGVSAMVVFVPEPPELNE